MRRLFLLLLAMNCGGAMAQAQPAGYPTRPVRVQVGFPPGGASDVVSRLVAQPLGERLGRPVIIENRPGVNGAIAADTVAKAAPDGHTLLVAGTPLMGLGKVLFPNRPYDPEKDLTPVTLLAASPFIVAVNPALIAATTVRELVAVVKARPGQFAFASTGNASAFQMAAELFKLLAGLDMLHVPYKGNGPVLADLAAGQIPIAFTDLGSTSSFQKSGRIRVLAIAAKQRTALAPDIPTAAESGLPGWEALGSFGLIGTGGTPAGVVARLNAEVTAILRRPDIRERILATSNEPAPMSIEEYGNFIRSERDKWVRVIREAGIKVEADG